MRVHVRSGAYAGAFTRLARGRIGDQHLVEPVGRGRSTGKGCGDRRPIGSGRGRIAGPASFVQCGSDRFGDQVRDGEEPAIEEHEVLLAPRQALRERGDVTEASGAEGWP